MEIEKILNIATEALKEIKAKDITTIDVEHLTQMMRYIVICTATSTTHANALSKNLEENSVCSSPIITRFQSQ